MNQQIKTSKIELSQKALSNNISYLRNILGEDIIFSSVVKGNAYGHGIEQFVPMLENCDVNHFSVFSADEAFRVNKASSKPSTIMIMGAVDDSEMERIVREGIQCYVFDTCRLESLIKAAKRTGTAANIHLEFETGFNRTGFNKNDFSELITIINSNRRYISIEGMCTNFAGAESIANYYRIQKQIKLFNKYVKVFSDSGIKPKLRHSACSAAAISYPNTRMDLVRIGILQYGFWPSKETLINHLSRKTDKSDPLNRIISWKSKIMSTKEIKIGEFVGYGTSYLAQRDMKIATVPVGYAQGFSRSMSNHGRALVDGTRVSVIGVVNMNCIIIDVTDCDSVNIGDEVTLIGNQNELSISVSSFSDLSDQLNYESLTRLPVNIPRFVKE